MRHVPAAPSTRRCDERIAKELAPRADATRKLEPTDWQTLAWSTTSEVEEQMNSDRFGQLISHECEWELRELAAYMGSLLRLGRADDDRNPLRAEIIGTALYRGIEAVTERPRRCRKVLARELGQRWPRRCPQCYARHRARRCRQRGVQPVSLTVRTRRGPGQPAAGVQLGYASLASTAAAAGSSTSDGATAAGTTRGATAAHGATSAAAQRRRQPAPARQRRPARRRPSGGRRAPARATGRRRHAAPPARRGAPTARPTPS